MRNLPQSLLDHLDSRPQMALHTLFWVRARDRATGAIVSTGFWSGADHQDFVIGGAVRGYFGAGALLDALRVVARKGLDVQRQEIKLSGLAPEVLAMLRGYDLRAAGYEIHQAAFDALTMQLVAEPQPEGDGVIETLDEVQAPPSEDGAVTMRLASGMRQLTFKLPLTKSDEAMKPDRLYRYADISGSVQTIWGEKKAKEPGGGA